MAQRLLLTLIRVQRKLVQQKKEGSVTPVKCRVSNLDFLIKE